MLNLPRKIKTVLHHPSIIKSIISGKKLAEIRSEIHLKLINLRFMKQ